MSRDWFSGKVGLTGFVKYGCFGHLKVFPEPFGNIYYKIEVGTVCNGARASKKGPEGPLLASVSYIKYGVYWNWIHTTMWCHPSSRAYLLKKLFNSVTHCHRFAVTNQQEGGYHFNGQWRANGFRGNNLKELLSSWLELFLQWKKSYTRRKKTNMAKAKEFSRFFLNCIK